MPLLLLLSGLLVSILAIQNPYYLDDLIVLKDNTWLMSLSSPIPWFQTLFADSNHFFPAYRPTLMTSFWINARLLGESPVAYRTGNILIHLFNGFLLVRILLSLNPSKDRKFIGWGAGFLFLLHPIQTLGINFLWKRSSLFEATWVFLSLYMHIRERQRTKYRPFVIPLQVILFLLAITTKESAVVLFALIPMIDFIFFRSRSVFKKRLTYCIYSAIGIVGALFIYFRLWIMPEWLSHQPQPFADRRLISGAQYLVSQFSVIPQYLFLAIYPRPLVVDDPIAPSMFPFLGFFMTIAALAVSAIAAIRFRRNPLISFGFALFWIALLVTSGPVSIYLIMDQIRLYLPLAGLATLVATALSLLNNVRLRFTFLSLAILIFAGLSARQNLRYAKPADIWNDVVQEYTNSGLAWGALGDFNSSTNDFGAARTAYENAVRVEPEREAYRADSLYCAFRLGMSNETLRSELKRIDINRLDAKRLVNVAIVEAETGNPWRAEEILLRITEATPQFGLGHLNLAILWEKTGQTERAFRAYRNALVLMPNDPTARSGYERTTPRALR